MTPVFSSPPQGPEAKKSNVAGRRAKKTPPGVTGAQKACFGQSSALANRFCFQLIWGNKKNNPAPIFFAPDSLRSMSAEQIVRVRA